MKHKSIRIFAVVTIALAQIAMAQITYETKVNSDGFMGMGAFESTAKTYIQDDAQRTDTKLKFTGAFMKIASPKGTTTTTIDLKKKLIREFDDKKKTYTERTFDEIRKSFSDLGQNKNKQDALQGASTEDYENTYEWSKPIVKVDKLKDKKTINGFDCQHYLASVTTVGTHKETGIKDTMLFVSDLWNAKNASKKMELVNKFNKRYMKAIGFDMPDNQGLAMMAGMYKDQLETLNDEVSKLKGYPIINDMKLSMTKNLSSTSTDKSAKEETMEEEGVSLKDIQRDFGGLLGKKIMKDVLDKKAKKKTDTQQKSSIEELFHMKSEVLSISEGNIKSNTFDVKTGYKLKKN